MRVSFMGLLALGVCAGCAAGTVRVVDESIPKSGSQAESSAVPEPGETVSESNSIETVTESESSEPAAVPLAMTDAEIRALVTSAVAEAFARREQQAAATPLVEANQLVDEARTAARDVAQSAAQEAARAASQARHEESRRQAADAAEAARRDDEALARFLLLPDELQRVERIRKQLESESIWRLTRQDLDFAAAGIAAPLLHDALYAAAQRHDPEIALDALAKKVQLTPADKIQLAELQPVERQRLLMFTDQFEGDNPSVEADRYIREYINRYPFVRKILLAHLHPKE